MHDMATMKRFRVANGEAWIVTAETKEEAKERFLKGNLENETPPDSVGEITVEEIEEGR